MADSNFKIVVANYIPDVFGGKDMAFDTVVVTKTATMGNGSILKDDGTEAAIADAAVATHIVDQPSLDLAEVGDVVAVSALSGFGKVTKAHIKFSDGAYTNETLTALAAAGVKLV